MTPNGLLVITFENKFYAQYSMTLISDIPYLSVYYLGSCGGGKAAINYLCDVGGEDMRIWLSTDRIVSLIKMRKGAMGSGIDIGNTACSVITAMFDVCDRVAEYSAKRYVVE